MKLLGPPIMYDKDLVVKDDEICLHELNFYWNSFSLLVCGLVKYNVTLYRYNGMSEVAGDATVNRFYNFTNLQEDTTYEFTVFGYNLAGNGNRVTKRVKTSKINGRH